MNIQYRLATKKDQEKLQKLDLISADKRLLKYSQQKVSLFNIDEYFQSGGGFWVAKENDNIVGMIGVRFLNDYQAKIKALRIHPDYRRLGIAKRLMDILEHYCQEKQIKEVILGVNKNTLAANQFYKYLGYVKYDEKEVEPKIIAYYYKKTFKN